MPALTLTAAAAASAQAELTNIARISGVLRRFNEWAVEVAGKPYYKPPADFDTDFRLSTRWVGRWGFPPYYRVWMLDHLPSDQSLHLREGR